MSFNLGNWADQLRCDMCTGDDDVNLNLPLDYGMPGMGDLPDDFWDDPPEPADDPFDFDVPDWYPYAEFPDGGFIFGIHGSF